MLLSRQLTATALATGFVVVSGGQASSAPAWAPPAGVPIPPFGIAQAAPAPPSPWTKPTEGFYYVEETAAAATDTGNPYGTPARPRRTIPSSLPAGAVVELHGTYTKAHTSPHGFSVAGTPTRPAFIRGASASARPTITRAWEVSGSYFVLENLSFTFLEPGRGQLALIAPITHAALRASEVRGNHDGGGVAVGGGGSAAASDVVIRGNVIHDNGDVDAKFDQDVHGISVGAVSNLWILDNTLYRNSGDGIQINGKRASTHHIYVGRNVSHHNKQTGLWTKTASDVIFSENRVYGHRPSDSSSGAGAGFQYDPQRVWFLFNECYDNTIGMTSGSEESGGRSDIHFIGNVAHDNLSAGLRLNGWVDREYVVGNTFYANPIGLENGYHRVGLEISDNIFSASSAAHISFREYGAGAASHLRNNLFDPPVRIVWDDVTRDVDGMRRVGECGGCRSGSPLFVDPADGNFGLQAGSPAIDSGTAESVYATFQSLYGIDIAKDRAGRARPQGAGWDMGAYESANVGAARDTDTPSTGSTTPSPR